MSVLPVNRRGGFSLLEIVIAISVLAILAGVMTLRSGTVIEKGKVQNALETLDAIRKASVMYHADTGQFAHEYAGYAANNRRLSGIQTLAGWSGPYLESQLPVNANPWGGTTHLYRTVTANSWIPGFDVDGDGNLDVTSNGNMVYFARVDEGAARRIDETLDKTTPGAWNETGKVRYIAASQTLLVLVHW